ncbi:MAG: NAD-dependent epimerase/dehydratase family protein [Candidatus Limnocylindrales bacterium]
MRALVTGGAGFIGHHLVRGLLDRNDHVTVIDDFSSGDRSRLEGFRDRITLVEGSILDAQALDRAAQSCEVIFHEAAIASVARSLDDPMLTNAVNAGGTIEVMLAAARHGARRVVFAGSSAAYGTPLKLPCREDQVPAPVSAYGASKLAAEYYVHALGRLHGVDTVVLRYFNVFGPGQDPASEYAAVVPSFATAILEDRQPIVNGSGEISRDFVYIDDVVEANLLAARPTSPSGLTCNIASGSRSSLLLLLESINTAAGRRVEPIFGPARNGDIPHSYADISVARQALGYTVRVPFGEGIRRTIAWYRAVGSRPA